jgi:hypothetical protein
VSEYDCESWTMRRPWPTRGCCTTGKKMSCALCVCLCVCVCVCVCVSFTLASFHTHRTQSVCLLLLHHFRVQREYFEQLRINTVDKYHRTDFLITCICFDPIGRSSGRRNIIREVRFCTLDVLLHIYIYSYIHSYLFGIWEPCRCGVYTLTLKI